MSLSASDLSSIQQAGVALHNASQCLNQALRTQAQAMVERVTAEPTHLGSDNVIAPLRALAGLNHELQTMELQLKRVYADLSGLQFVPLHESAEPARRRSPVRSERVRRKTVALTLSPNDTKVLTYLRSALNTSDWTPLTGAVVAAGAGLPKGSVGVSITRVLASGAVRRGAGGTYQLAAS